MMAKITKIMPHPPHLLKPLFKAAKWEKKYKKRDVCIQVYAGCVKPLTDLSRNSSSLLFTLVPLLLSLYLFIKWIHKLT